MKIETKYSVGDQVWAVELRSRNPLWAEVQCDSCNGEGGAVIPATKIRIECEACGGEGKSELTGGPVCHVSSGTIHRVTVQQGPWRKDIVTSYEFTRPHGYRENTPHIFDSRDEAVACAERLDTEARSKFAERISGKTVLNSTFLVEAEGDRLAAARV